MTSQARIDWLKGRQAGIGGSEIAAIVGLNQYTTPMQVWESKVNPVYVIGFVKFNTSELKSDRFWSI